MNTNAIARNRLWMIPHREVIGRYELRPGNYVMVPTTQESGKEAEFMIRLYAGKRVELKPLP
jgi:hypothetical protein